MILFLHGEDDFRRLRRVQVFREGFKTKYDNDALNLHEIDCASFDVDQFRSKMMSSGLFTSKQFMVLSNVWKLNKDQQEVLMAELDNVGEESILVVSAGKPPRKDNKLFKRLLKAQKVEEYAELNDFELREFIQKEATTFEAAIEGPAIDALVAAVGNDLWRLHNEIRKLSGYTKQITANAVAEFIETPADDNIFHLTDALGNRNAAKATELLEQQFDAGANEHYLLTMLSKHIGTLIKVKKTDGVGLKMHPYVKEKAIKQSASFTEKQLDALYWKLLEIDKQTKTGNANARTLLDLFLIEACA